MQPQAALDKRQHPRRDASLVVSYRPEDLTARYDITHTRNVSQGGMLLTTARAFGRGVVLAVHVKLTYRGSSSSVQGTAEVVESREVVSCLIYETRVRFLDWARRSRQILGDFRAGEADPVAAMDRSAMSG